VLAGSQILSQVAIFVRNLLVVRALSPPEYGVAATFLLALTLGQSFANLSIATLVAQAPDGEEPSFQRPAQFAQDEAVVYDVCIELHRERCISDATWARAIEHLGEAGVVDLVGLNGYYALLAMVMNAARTPA